MAAKYLIENVGGFDFRLDGKRIPLKETRASWAAAEKRVRAQLAALGADEIEVTPLLGMTVFSGGHAKKFVIEEVQ